VLKGPTATFKALLYNDYSQTLPEYKQQQSSFFNKKTNLFAMTLIRLWTSTQEQEIGNFIPHYRVDHNQDITNSTLLKKVVPYYQSSAKEMHQQFIDGRAQNLGALTILNLLMSSKLTSNSLGIAKSPVSQRPVFTQKLCTFWQDYFEAANTIHLFNRSSVFEQKLLGFTRNNKYLHWWSSVVNPQNNSSNTNPIILQRLFLKEMFEVALRICVTPECILEKIANNILGENELSTPFISYFFKKIRQFREQFFSLMSQAEIQLWFEFIKEHGLLAFQLYQTDLAQFKIMDHLIINDVSIKVPEWLMVNATLLNIPQLTHCYSMAVIRGYSIESKGLLFGYLMGHIRLNWQVVATNSADEAWDFIDQLVQGYHAELQLNQSKLNFSQDDLLFLRYLAMKSIQLGKNELSTFLVLQNPQLTQEIILKSDYIILGDEQWIRHSLIYIAQQANNAFMASFFKEMGANLLHHEQAPFFEQSPKMARPIPRRRRTTFFVEKPSESIREITQNPGNTI